MEVDKKSLGKNHQDNIPEDGGNNDESMGFSQEVPVNYGLLSLIGLGISIGVVWPASGGSIQVAIANGGAPGTLSFTNILDSWYLTEF
jgi:hypothetical protein